MTSIQEPLRKDSTQYPLAESFQKMENAASQFEDIIKNFAFHTNPLGVCYGKTLQNKVKSIALYFDNLSNKTAEEGWNSKDIETIQTLKDRFSQMHKDLKNQLKI
ncbi:MAG: hypothetical protein HWD61_01365 [Parachlamydiaceae bacterium]|nr:MAG: hypothetical protein HWD61_01365 [Parachlamydiaceae bacterium]